MYFITKLCLSCRAGIDIHLVLTAECPNSSCTSFGTAPFERRLLVEVCRNWWKWKFSNPSSRFATDRQASVDIFADMVFHINYSFPDDTIVTFTQIIAG